MFGHLITKWQVQEARNFIPECELKCGKRNEKALRFQYGLLPQQSVFWQKQYYTFRSGGSHSGPPARRKVVVSQGYRCGTAAITNLVYILQWTLLVCERQKWWYFWGQEWLHNELETLSYFTWLSKLSMNKTYWKKDKSPSMELKKHWRLVLWLFTAMLQK